MKLTIATALVLAIALSACQKQQNPTSQEAQTPSTPAQDVFVGCYGIHKDKPAQIKISLDNNQYTMQMKEPASAKTVWDKPESLKLISTDEAWDFFGVNQLDLNKSDVESVIARPDKMMVLAKVKSVAQHINPHLDSPYVVYIFKGSNTIYQMPCDDTPLDIIKYH